MGAKVLNIALQVGGITVTAEGVRLSRTICETPPCHTGRA